MFFLPKEVSFATGRVAFGAHRYHKKWIETFPTHTYAFVTLPGGNIKTFLKDDLFYTVIVLLPRQLGGWFT